MTVLLLYKELPVIATTDMTISLMCIQLSTKPSTSKMPEHAVSYINFSSYYYILLPNQQHHSGKGILHKHNFTTANKNDQGDKQTQRNNTTHTAQCRTHSYCPASHIESLSPVQAEKKVREELKQMSLMIQQGRAISENK